MKYLKSSDTSWVDCVLPLVILGCISTQLIFLKNSRMSVNFGYFHSYRVLLKAINVNSGLQPSFFGFYLLLLVVLRDCQEVYWEPSKIPMMESFIENSSWLKTEDHFHKKALCRCLQGPKYTSCLFTVFTRCSFWKLQRLFLKHQPTEGVVRRCFVKEVFLKFLQNLQKNTCVRVSTLIKL